MPTEDLRLTGSGGAYTETDPNNRLSQTASAVTATSLTRSED